MQSVSIEEVRKLAPGARLQPLRDRGVRTLWGCQGWGSLELNQLRGIGPDSAIRIAKAIEVLTKSANSQPVPHPQMTDAGCAPKLYCCIYHQRQAQEILSVPGTALQNAAKELLPRCASVIKETAFFDWAYGSEKQGALKTALDEAEAIRLAVLPDEAFGKISAAAANALRSARQLSQSAVTVEIWAGDASDNRNYYSATFDRLLGTSSDTTSHAPIRVPSAPSAPRPAPATEPVRIRVGVSENSSFQNRFEPAGQATSLRGPAALPNKCWVPADQQTKVGGLVIKPGLVYVGQNLAGLRGSSVEPALIDPSLPVSHREADCTVRMLEYWSSYSGATPQARASYLQWLTTGRSNPAADVGYVFLYFYGLERRVLSDTVDDAGARAEIPGILEEVRRLRSVYGNNSSFSRYSSEFLDYAEALQTVSAGFPNSEALPPLRQYHLSFSLRHGLAQFASAKKPLPPEWAFVWYHNDIRTRLMASALRCPDEFAALFKQEYARQFGEGLILPANKTRLKLTYRPASASFNGSLVQSTDLPDVSVLSGSYAKLEATGISCFSMLDGYSRYVARNQNERTSFEALVLLPAAIWPAYRKQIIPRLQSWAAGETLLTLRDLLTAFEEKTDPGRAAYSNFCRLLGGLEVGIEPDPRFGAEVPALEDPVSLFPSENYDQPSAGFGLASLILRLASVVAASDGDFSDEEAELLAGEINRNATIGPRDRKRLLARMKVYRKKAPGLTGLKPAIAGLKSEQRQRVTDFLISMIYADRVVAPGEVRVMEKIYALFGLENAELYSRLHDLSSGPVGSSSGPRSATTPSQSARGQGAPLQLNAEKVRALRAVSEEVTKKLTIIFHADETPLTPATTEPADTPEAAQEGALALDPAHTELLGVLATRSQWTRAEFEEVCADKGLPPDGAIERLNDAAFAKFDQPLIEGDDPLELAVHLLDQNQYASNDSTQRP